jgi:uncharacterized protein
MLAPAAPRIDRRQLLRTGAGLFAGLLLPAHALEASEETHARSGGALFASACRDPQGHLVVIVLDARSGALVESVELPERGHGIAVRPRAGQGAGTRELVTFARRPGNFAVVLDLDRTRVPLWLTTRPDRHFFGPGSTPPTAGCSTRPRTISTPVPA